MDKRDNDATMEVSTSQLVVDPPPARKRAMPPPAAPNDASMWAYRVVGTDDFAPTPAKGLATAAPRVRGWLVALLVLVIVAGGGYLAYARWFAPAPTAARAAGPTAPPEPAATPAAHAVQPTARPAPAASKPAAKKH